MATKRRETKINRNKRMTVRAYVAVLVLVGIAYGIGRLTTPPKVETKVVTETVTITKTVEVPIEVPVYVNKESLPEIDDVFFYDVPLSKTMQRYIYELCADEEIPVALVFAIIEHESGFNPEAVSHTDDYGLMQINKINFDWLEEEYRCADMTDPYQNVFCGTKIIGRLVDKYDGDIKHALLAYHLGEYGAQKAMANGVTETRASAEIYELMLRYEEGVTNVQ